MIDPILAHSATVKILATSREGLRLATNNSGRCRRWMWHRVAGGDLFVERAYAVAPTSRCRCHADADAVIEICRRLDGIPLAIELAASRLQSMTVTELRDRLDDRFRLLVGSRRGLERHQTLRHAVQWSFDLLDDDEKSLLTKFQFSQADSISTAPGRWRARVTNSSPWIYSMRWYGSHFWSPTDHRAGHDSRCWRPSANSPKNNSWLRRRPTRRVPRTPGTSQAGKPMCWRCGTAPSTPGLRLVHPRIGESAHRVPVGRRPRRPRHRRRHRLLRDLPRLLARAARAHAGPRNSSNPREPSTTGGWRSSTSWPRSVMRPVESTTRVAYPEAR